MPAVDSTSTDHAPRGRPRDPHIDAVVLEATRQLLAEVGFAATTVQEISRRSGVHPPAIYRRWPSRLALIGDAALSGLTEVRVRPTGDLRRDLRRFLHAFETGLATPAARAAIPGLISAAQEHSEQPVVRWPHLSLRPTFAAILRAAPGAVDPDLDEDEVFDVLEGAILARIVVPSAAASRRHVDSLVELFLRMLAPSGSPSGPGGFGVPADSPPTRV